MAIDPKIIERIRKLMSLGSNNDQTHEAEAALKKAAALAEEYGLALSDVDEETGEVSSVDKNSVSLTHQRHNCWSYPLANIVGSCFDCRTIIAKGRTPDDGKMIFIGTPTDLEMAIWYYKLIRLKTIRGASASFPLVKDQKMYGRGILTIMRVRLKEMFKKVQEELRTDKTTALVVVKKDAVDKRVHEEFPNLQRNKSSYKFNGSSDAYRKGMSDGASMGLHRGSIEGNNNQQIE